MTEKIGWPRQYEHVLSNALSARDGHEIVVLSDDDLHCWNCGWPVQLKEVVEGIADPSRVMGDWK